jgi:transposase
MLGYPEKRWRRVYRFEEGRARPLRVFYERLVGRGKPKKAALAAVARKLLTAINAMIRDRRPWQPDVVLQPSCC